MLNGLSFECTHSYKVANNHSELKKWNDTVIDGKIKVFAFNPESKETPVEIGEISCTCYNLKNVNFDPTCRDFEKASANSSLKIVTSEDIESEMYYNIFAECYTNMLDSLGYEDLSIMDVQMKHYGHFITLNKVFIKPEYRNQGVGTYIYKNIIDILCGCYHICSSCFIVGLCIVNDGYHSPLQNVSEKILLDNGYSLFNFYDAPAFYKCVL